MDRQVYGPQTAEVEALLLRVKDLTPDEAQELRETWAALNGPSDYRRSQQWDDAEKARNAERLAAWDAMMEVLLAMNEHTTVLRYAIWDAIAALISFKIVGQKLGILVYPRSYCVQLAHLCLRSLYLYIGRHVAWFNISIRTTTYAAHGLPNNHELWSRDERSS